MIRITSFFTAVLIFFGSLYASFLPKATAPMSEAELLALPETFVQKELSDVVYAVDLSGFTRDERYAAIALQGIVAKTEPCIFLMMSGADSYYLSEIEKSGIRVVRTDADGGKWTFRSLLLQFSDYIADSGFVLYENSEFAEGLNAATNFASAYGWLPVAASVRQTAQDCGLTMKKDLTGEKYGIAFQRKYFRELKKYLRKDALIHVKLENTGLRDLAISQGFFCFYTPGGEDGSESELFLREVVRWAGKNTPLFGWCEQEKKTVRLLSQLGCHMIASDYSYNCSYLSQCEADVRLPAREAQARTDETKHYATLVFSDGDNCQWIQNGYGEYFTLTGNYPDAAVTWTFSPVLRELCPFAVERTAAAANENTSFVCGPSGAGYCNPFRMDAGALDAFSTRTAAAMLKSGQRVLTVLDDYKQITEGKMVRSFDWFSRFENIDGGILYLDPDRYEAGKGKVWFSNGKPFASVRLSLWAQDGYDGATEEWLRQQAETVNAYPADIHSVNGYSVICIHAWTMKPGAVRQFIGMLDDHVEILSAADFLKTMEENVPHVTAAPD